jgi:DNA-directed RNA polymerase alpha subunit
LKKEKSELDRSSKETLKTLELMTKMSLEEQKNQMAEKQLKGKMLEKAADIEKDKDLKLAELEMQQLNRKGE